jgi:stress-induced morphogen
VRSRKELPGGTQKCKLCSNSFSYADVLKRHKRIHTGEKPYTCELCSYSFSRVSSLNRHKRIHAGEKSYTCKLCSSSFSDASTFKRHKRIHAGERPYKCDICSKSFSEAGALKEHKRIHTGEPPCDGQQCNQNLLGCIRIGVQSNASITSAGKFPEDIELLMKSRNDEKPYECYNSMNMYSKGDGIKIAINEKFMRPDSLTEHECCVREELPCMFVSSGKLEFCYLHTDVKNDSEQGEITSTDCGIDDRNSFFMQMNERICPAFVKEENVSSFAGDCKIETDWKLTVRPYVELFRIETFK